jgi:hypothetical protein
MNHGDQGNIQKAKTRAQLCPYRGIAHGHYSAEVRPPIDVVDIAQHINWQALCSGRIPLRIGESHHLARQKTRSLGIADDKPHLTPKPSGTNDHQSAHISHD